MKALFSLTTVAHKLDSILAITYPPLDLTPPILSYDPTQKSFRAAYLRSELDVLSATRDEVLGLQDKLRQIDQHLFQRQASIKFALSPLSAVPVEILQYIFRLYLPHEGDGSIDGTDEEFVRERLASSITLSHVCSSWRVVSLAMPALWNKICIDQNQTALSALARRSKNLPIDLFIKLPLSQTDAISDTPPSTRSLDLTSTGLTIQSDYSGRLSRLKLVDATTLQLGLSECEGSRMSLQSLELSSSGPLKTYTLSTGMSPAANLKLEGCQISNPSQIPMYRLERISFNNSSYWNIFQTLKELRGQCPSLRNIEMMSIYEETQRRYELDNRFTLIPSYGVDSVLEVLGIANCSMGLLYDIFQEWRMPLLKTLRLVHNDEGEAEAYMAYMEDPFTTLLSRSISVESLKFHIFPATLPCLTRALLHSECPRLSDLTILVNPNTPGRLEELDQSTFPSIQGILSARDSLIGSQKLRYLRIGGFDLSVRETNELREMVEELLIVPNAEITVDDESWSTAPIF